MHDFLTGVIAVSNLVASLFFLRFWRQSQERLFIYFALAFLLLSINRVALIGLLESAEPHTEIYLIRLLAFVLLLVGILEANRKRKK